MNGRHHEPAALAQNGNIPRSGRSAWQPRAVLLVVLPLAGLYALLQTIDVPSPAHLAFAAGVSLALAALTFLLRAARAPAACLGGLLAF